MNVIINLKDLEGKGFGCFLKDSVKKTGTAEIFIDIDAMLNAGVFDDVKFNEIFLPTVAHEILHGVQELFNKSFDEEAVENAIEYNQGLLDKAVANGN